MFTRKARTYSIFHNQKQYNHKQFSVCHIIIIIINKKTLIKTKHEIGESTQEDNGM